ncbi:MAG TPA: NUDIX domain-containing protein [Gaiellaceae bacterium]|nr:NUDIX domain-containing protein [Gaiellaceae bacterium]
MKEWSEVLIHVRRGEEFLCTHRAPDGGGYWHVIAGGVEPGEEFHAAALRELEEETGLALERIEPIGEFAYVREPWESEPGLRVHVECFLADVGPEWEPQLDREHDDYRWCMREEAIELLFWPEPAQLLRSLP